ncbi:MAG: small subunit ribosomal protein [Patescibacteria group bacterium]|jgi:small subunit ribosomal protein S16|nr:small subunit ribosomal protein [Patescibacteria group bacterium]
MLKIRFNRTGKRNQASYRLVLQEHTVAPGGRHIEVMGSHNPHTKQTVLRTERIQYWMGQGAQLSPTVHNLLVKEGVIEGKKIVVKMDRPVVEEPAVAEAVADKAVVEEVKVEEAPVEEATEVEAVAEIPVEAVEAPVAEEKTEEVK